MSSSEDEDLKAAIALSLADATETPAKRKIGTKKAVVIDISSDEEDDNLDAPQILKKCETQMAVPLALEKQHVTKSATTKDAFPFSNTSSGLKSDTSNAKADTTTRSGGLIGIDRKQMEWERLERAKLKASQQAPLSEFEGQQKRKISPDTTKSLENRRVKSKAFISISSTVASQVASFNDQKKLGALGVQFPDGVVKKTWVYGCPREDDIKIEEVLQNADLEIAVLSAFQIDPGWIRSKLSQSTKVVWVLQARTEEEKANMRSQAPPEYQFCFPSMEGQINCMHSKLQLLAHPTHLRVVVPSANLVPYDWGETGVMENIVFIIDLPRLPAGSLVAAEDLTDFGKELRYFLDAQGMKSSILNSLLKFDFSRTKKLAFVHSIGGSHSNDSWRRTGYCGLGSAIRSLGLQTDDPVDIELVTASIGNLNDSMIRALYLAAQGDSGVTEYGWRLNKCAKTALTTGEDVVLKDAKDRFRIYFPTRDTVAQSKGGLGSGGTICFQSKWYNASTFPKHLLRNCQSRRPGILMHSKMLFVRPSNPAVQAWAYVGSANLSESAWGRLVKDRISQQPKINIRNWECGVVISVPHPEIGSSTRTAPRDTDIFHQTIPVPMVVPGEQYGEDQQPWYYNQA
ncbi:tyrosyl-DNA phosphodiesterase-domain-containing protein [Calycina marina]|uniref:Tyrosyl-DNA phosphodiesterase-domain-containing protein n=1 Tax=Calycina marina TaxID=1763456 RepID=A0A9P8CDY9_9HELO|nr:tyrosyl-DNA phosphodiesterase-domain-containing protein [Calycina marina]